MFEEELAKFREDAAYEWYNYIFQDRRQASYKVGRFVNRALNKLSHLTHFCFCMAPRERAAKITSATLINKNLNYSILNYCHYHQLSPASLYTAFSFEESNRDLKRFRQFTQIATAIHNANSLEDLAAVYRLAQLTLHENKNEGHTKNLDQRCKQLINLTRQYINKIVEKIQFDYNYRSASGIEFKFYLMNLKLLKGHESLDRDSIFTIPGLPNATHKIEKKFHRHFPQAPNLQQYFVKRLTKENAQRYELLTADEKKFVEAYWYTQHHNHITEPYLRTIDKFCQKIFTAPNNNAIFR